MGETNLLKNNNNNLCKKSKSFKQSSIQEIYSNKADEDSMIVQQVNTTR